MWHHEHHFHDIVGGTAMRDIVHYAVPGGPLGDIINRRLVQRRVAAIFARRRRVLDKLFGTSSHEPARAVTSR